MNKTLFTCILLLISNPLLAEANVQVDEQSKTFLLTAPGTLSGFVSPPEEELSGAQAKPRFYPPLRYKSQHDNRVESLKFPQYGQVYGNKYNPWSEQEANRPLPPSLPPANPYFSNPWDLSGRMPAQRSTPAYPVTPYFSAGRGAYDLFSFDQGMAQDYPDAIYRDTNPASGAFFDGLMPGMRGDNMSFPFSPFKMF